MGRSNWYKSMLKKRQAKCSSVSLKNNKKRLVELEAIKRFHCHVCNVPFENEQLYQFHNTTRKHKDTAAAFARRVRLRKHVASGPAAATTEQYSAVQAVGNNIANPRWQPPAALHLPQIMPSADIERKTDTPVREKENCVIDRLGNKILEQKTGSNESTRGVGNKVNRISAVSRESSSVKNEKSHPQQSKFYCHLCDIPCHSSKNYKIHKNGRKHKAKRQAMAKKDIVARGEESMSSIDDQTRISPVAPHLILSPLGDKTKIALPVAVENNAVAGRDCGLAEKYNSGHENMCVVIKRDDQIHDNQQVDLQETVGVNEKYDNLYTGDEQIEAAKQFGNGFDMEKEVSEDAPSKLTSTPAPLDPPHLAMIYTAIITTPVEENGVADSMNNASGDTKGSITKEEVHEKSCLQKTPVVKERYQPLKTDDDIGHTPVDVRTQSLENWWQMPHIKQAEQDSYTMGDRSDYSMHTSNTEQQTSPPSVMCKSNDSAFESRWQMPRSKQSEKRLVDSTHTTNTGQQTLPPSKMRKNDTNSNALESRWQMPRSKKAGKDSRERGGCGDSSIHNANTGQQTHFPDTLSAPLSRKKLERLARHSSRSRNISERGDEVIVKDVVWSGGSHKKRCNMAVDPNKLFRLRCTKQGCKARANMSEIKSEYLWCRRRTKKVLGLLSVSAPLNSKSFSLINNTARSCGIISNTNVAHLTFAEGLKIWRSALPSLPIHPGLLEFTYTAVKRLRVALFTDPSVKINSLHTVPRLSDDKTLLVIADVSLGGAANDAVKKILSNQDAFALPQFPLHVAVGACPTNDADAIIAHASSELIGLVLAVDADSLAVLPPSLNENINCHFSSSKDDAVAPAGKERHKTSFSNADSPAAKASDQLNKMLMQSAASMFSWSNVKSPGRTNSSFKPHLTRAETYQIPITDTTIPDCPIHDKNDMESLVTEVKQQETKIELLCSKIAQYDREIEERGLI